MKERPRRSSSSGYYTPYLLLDAAKEGKLYVVTCKSCKRVTNFVARDLAMVMDATQKAESIPFKCSKCKHSDFIDVDLRAPNPGDYGHLLVQRPNGMRHIQLWKSVLLGGD